MEKKFDFEAVEALDLLKNERFVNDSKYIKSLIESEQYIKGNGNFIFSNLVFFIRESFFVKSEQLYYFKYLLRDEELMGSPEYLIKIKKDLQEWPNWIAECLTPLLSGAVYVVKYENKGANLGQAYLEGIFIYKPLLKEDWNKNHFLQMISLDTLLELNRVGNMIYEPLDSANLVEKYLLTLAKTFLKHPTYIFYREGHSFFTNFLSSRVSEESTDFIKKYGDLLFCNSLKLETASSWPYHQSNYNRLPAYSGNSDEEQIAFLVSVYCILKGYIIVKNEKAVNSDVFTWTTISKIATTEKLRNEGIDISQWLVLTAEQDFVCYLSSLYNIRAFREIIMEELNDAFTNSSGRNSETFYFRIRRLKYGLVLRNIQKDLDAYAYEMSELTIRALPKVYPYPPFHSIEKYE